MLAVQPRRILTRPKSLFVFALVAATLYWVLLHGSSVGRHAIGPQDKTSERPAPHTQVGQPAQGAEHEQTPLQGDSTSSDAEKKQGPASGSINAAAAAAEEEERKQREEHDRFEDGVRKQWELESDALGRLSNAGAIYGNTLATLVNKTSPRKKMFDAVLKPADEMTGFSVDRPFVYDPYPHYNNKEWKATKKAEFAACDGPDGVPVEDIRVFAGAPHEFPAPGFGSYEVLNMDGNLCFERETRLSPYGYSHNGNHTRKPEDWEQVKWGSLQEICVQKNKARFNSKGAPNPYWDALHSRDNSTSDEQSETPSTTHVRQKAGKKALLRRRFLGTEEKRSPEVVKESRTALLIRTYTGKEYSENDKQIVRSLVTELSLRTGGQYQVFLFVQVKDNTIGIWENQETYEWMLHQSVPKEFVDMTILWNDVATESTYSKLSSKQASVHVAQWLSVQKFAQEFTEFDYVWNWELDSRVTGHHYDFLEKLVAFAKKQPRRGLWERNERFYIPSVHGDYDTDFRKEVESHAVNGSVWGPPTLPFIQPVGPEPPVSKPEDDDFKWGVGEEADLITLAPIFNPINSSWIGGTDVWGYNDSTHDSQDLPRRATIITQSRVSRRLLDIMHVENLKGNHVSSEMTPQTVALLHGFKAVYAPMPVFFDRAWSGDRLAKWFNGGLNGESGGIGSAMGWGREGRYGGSTWYYRANPPQRLYNNWMGWEDTGIGGLEWEDIHGRPCLPPMILHPIKDVEETEPGHTSESRLPYS
ncbi:hypothetical protein JX266_003965 [Neoarthrinium moseri]|nr:hypothetical protein JX266_003965 [Neoarthrinium moseri]